MWKVLNVSAFFKWCKTIQLAAGHNQKTSASERNEVSNYSYRYQLYYQLLFDTFSLSQDVYSIYKHHLLISTESQKQDIEYQKLKIKKSQLEIKQLNNFGTLFFLNYKY